MGTCGALAFNPGFLENSMVGFAMWGGSSKGPGEVWFNSQNRRILSRTRRSLVLFSKQGGFIKGPGVISLGFPLGGLFQTGHAALDWILNLWRFGIEGQAGIGWIFTLGRFSKGCSWS